MESVFVNFSIFQRSKDKTNFNIEKNWTKLTLRIIFAWKSNNVLRKHWLWLPRRNKLKGLMHKDNVWLFVLNYYLSVRFIPSSCFKLSIYFSEALNKARFTVLETVSAFFPLFCLSVTEKLLMQMEWTT